MAKTGTPLAEIRKTRMLTRWGRTTLECWGAETTDGIWAFDREESSGTPWLVIHRPTGTFVDQLGTLRACRSYVAEGHAQAMLERLQAHERGEHEGHRDSWCGRC